MPEIIMPQFNLFTVLDGSRRSTLPGIDAGIVHPDQEIDVTLHLRRRKDLNVLDLASKGEFISRSDLETHYGAAVEDIELALSFAQHFGLRTKMVDAGKRIVVVSGTSAAISQAFHVHLQQREINGKTFHAHLGHVLLPHELQGIVTGVFGLDHRPQARPHFRISEKYVPSIGKPNGFDGNQLASIYDFPASDGKGQTIAIIELGGGYLDIDIKAFFAALNLPAPKVTSQGVAGGANMPLLDPNADTEVALDIEVSGAAAVGASLVVYFAPNTDAGFLQCILAAIHDSINKPGIMSISWGAAESAWTSQQMAAMDEAFQSAAAIGMSVFCAAGDDGANDNVNDGKAHVDFPASSPHVSACGGTTLTLSNNSRQETTWNDGNGSATGGGISDFFAIPEYQKQISLPVSLASNFAGRGVPDVSAVADPNTGYSVLVDGVWQMVGGTSAVSPLFSGLLARINSATGELHGLINPVLYQAASNNGFNDITDGNNSVDGVTGYSAAAGWDPVSGWGSPGGVKLLNLLDDHPKTNAA